MEDNRNFSNEIDMDINSDADVPGSTHLSNPDLAMVSENEKLSADLQEQKDKYLRLVAEFDNFKRRTARERIELSQSAGKDIIVSLLDVLDDSERAEKQMQNSDDIKLAREGIMLVFNKFRNTLQQKGLAPMKSIDNDFDVEKHEAIAEVDVEKNKQGKVIDDVQKGYYLNDKIIRFAKVVVGK